MVERKENLDDIVAPIWGSGVQYRETMAMIEESGECRAPFARVPERVLRVESYDGQQVYEENRDYVVENGELIRTKNSTIPCAKWDALFYASEAEAVAGQKREEARRGKPLGFGPVATTDGRYINLSGIENPSYITQRQIAVTYETKEQWMEWHPVSQLDALPNFAGKISRREPARIVLYGDSISCGYDCSGMYGLPPHQPIWPELLLELLKRENPQTMLTNTAVGGMDSVWGIEHASERVCAYRPDLVILAFGMNDRCSGREFGERIRKLMTVIRRELPAVEFLLVSTTLPNVLAATPPIYFCAHQEEQGEVLREMCGRFERTALADVQRMQEILERRKRYIDLTGNWLNHPNDYLARVQLQVIAAALGVLQG